MKNQRGLTLIEILATITITTIILGVGFMLFASINGLFNNTVQKYADNTSINAVIDTISREMADPVALYYLTTANGSELRFQTFDNRYMALVYDQNSKSLSLAKSTSTNTTQDITAFTFLTPSKVLSDNVMADAANSSSAFTVINNATSNALATGTSYMAANLNTVNLTVKFEVIAFTPNGGKKIAYKPYNVIVSLSYP
jgi:prepilin-type N-terminal cleavage/methylation domain-containing protein